jgi:pilus biogenesis lipoprotein CpaD
MKQFLVLLALPLLAACAMKNASFVNQQKMLVVDEQTVFERSADKLTKGDLMNIADDIKRRGNGTVDVAIVYPLQKGQERVASAQGNMIRNMLTQNGVRQPVRIDLQPTGVASPNMVAISYNAVRAGANCNGDIADADADNYTHATDNSYSLGCSRDKYMAQMIARPEDLLGNDTMSPTDSQRLGKSQDTYRAGEPATPEGTTGLSASDVYNQ